MTTPTKEVVFAKAKQYIIDNELTSAQIQGVSKMQVGQAIGEDLSNCTFFNGIKRRLMQFARIEEAKREYQDIKQKLINVGILTLFPNMEFDRSGFLADRSITIWPLGKPLENP